MENRGTKSIEQVASDIGVSRTQLYGWRERFESEATGKATNGQTIEELQAENQQLKKSLCSVQKERELLKNQLPSSSKKMGERCCVHPVGEGIYSIDLLCDVVEISRSHYYQSTSGAVSSRKLEDARLRVAIREINEEGEGKYGSPRIHDALLKRGFKVSRKRVIRLMKERNWCEECR